MRDWGWQSYINLQFLIGIFGWLVKIRNNKVEDEWQQSLCTDTKKIGGTYDLILQLYLSLLAWNSKLFKLNLDLDLHHQGNNSLISNINYVYWIINMKQLLGTIKIFFFRLYPKLSSYSKYVEMFGCKRKKSWLFPAIFSCSASKCIDVKN